jgi:hypothetical protein
MKNLAREINEKLDDLINLYEEYKALRDKVSYKTKNVKEAEEVISLVHDDINKITNNGKNVRDIFTNDFYVNDLTQDKFCNK